MKTKILSGRFPVAEIQQIDVICEELQITRSEWLQEQIDKASVYNQVEQLLRSLPKRRRFLEEEEDKGKLIQEIKMLFGI